MIDYVTFTLVPGTDRAAFLAAASATEPLVWRQPGFIARRPSQGQ